jgi:predicted ATPase/DNA-binding SARP family transcriptional activator
MRVWLLGGFRVTIGERTVDERGWRLRKAKSLVKLLALAHGHRLHRDRLLDTLWPELLPDAAAHNLYQALYVARQVLDPDRAAGDAVLPLEGEIVSLTSDGAVWTDVNEFRSAAARASERQTMEAYRKALDLHSGDLLPEDPYEEWAIGPRNELRRERLTLLLDLARLQESTIGYSASITTLQQALHDEPAEEQIHRSLMRLYALTGSRREALRQYQMLRKALDDELGIQPDSETESLCRAIVDGTFPAPEERRPSPSVAASNLPEQLTSFVGRDHELAELGRLLLTHRLVTLTGVGGGGKTRLALRVAEEQQERFGDAACFVELASLSSPALVPQAIAVATGVREQAGRSATDTLLSALESREMLLLIDNCEHLLASRAELAELVLRSCPNVRLLATSREPLHVPGEFVWNVSPLPVPDLAQRSLDDLLTDPSVQLFYERARSQGASLLANGEDGVYVAEICRRLEGIPLAVELAAARTRVLSPRQIAGRLAEDVGILASRSRTSPERQRTLKATLDWSVRLLSAPERALYRRLAIFAGGWTLDAAEAVVSGDGVEEATVLDLLEHLVDKSLVVADVVPAGRMRYRLLEPIRQHARESLFEAREYEVVARRHALYFRDLAEQAEVMLSTAEQANWLIQLDGERDNVRAALAWSRRTGEAETGLRIASALWRFWWLRGYFSEGRSHFEALLDSPGTTTSLETRARALYALGVLIFRHADFAADDQAIARRHLEESLRIHRELGDDRRTGELLRELGRVAIELGEFERAHPLLRESLDLATRHGDRHAAALTRSSLGWVHLFEERYEEARPFLEQSMAEFEQLGDTLYIGICLFFLGRLATDIGDYGGARTRFSLLLRDIPLQEFRWGLPFTLEGVARLAAAQGMAGPAIRLASAAPAVRHEIGASLGPSWQRDLDRRLTVAREALGEDAYAAEWARGQALTLDQVFEEARRV